MSDRITKERLASLVEHLNKMTNNKVGYSIDYSYGGARLVDKDHRDILNRTTKAVQFDLIHAMLKGIYVMQDLYPMVKGI